MHILHGDNDCIGRLSALNVSLPANHGSAHSPERVLQTPMAQAPTSNGTPAPTNLDKVMAALAAAPQAQMSALDIMVRQVAAKQGLDYVNLTSGKKAALKKRVMAAIKEAGISL